MDDIWDEPAVVSATDPRTYEPLFTFSDEEDATKNAPQAARRKTVAKAKSTGDVDDIVAELFDDIIDPMDGQPTPATDAVLARRGNTAKSASNDTNKDQEASGTRTAASPKPDDDQDGKSKPRRTIAKVDEQRLLSERGIPALVKEAKKFKPKGKGHETEDLDRLMSIYQFWAHNMFPKTQFRDTIDRVERVCRSRRMLINMSMWRDAENSSQRPERDPNKSDSSDNENEENIAAAAASSNLDSTRTQQSVTSPPAQPTANSRAVPVGDDADLWDDVDEALAELPTNNYRPPTAPSNNPPGPQSYPDDDELEDWFNADSDPVIQKPTQSVPHPDPMDVDDSAGPSTTISPQRMLSPPRADNWDEDLFS